MQLLHWKEAGGYKLREMSAMLLEQGTPAPMYQISLHMNGVSFPSPRYIDAYSKLTNGEVTYDDFSRLRRAKALGLSVAQLEEREGTENVS
jgi:hypothetical protein